MCERSTKSRCSTLLSLLLEVLEDGVDVVERLVDLLPNFGTGQHDLPGDKDEEDDARLDHAVYEAGEQLGLVGAELAVREDQALEADGELDVAGADHVLDLEVFELGWESEFLDNTSVFSSR